MCQIRHAARHFHPPRSRAAHATMARQKSTWAPPPRRRPTPPGARPAQLPLCFDLAADDDSDDGGGAAAAAAAHDELLSWHTCSVCRAVMVAATRFCSRCKASLYLAPVAAFTAAPTTPRSTLPTPTKRAAAEDKQDDAAARTTTQPPVTRRTTTPPLAHASSATADLATSDRAPTTPRSPPPPTPPWASKRWVMHETFKDNPGDSWVEYVSPRGRVWWWSKQTEEWLFRPGCKDGPGEKWEHYQDLQGKIYCWNRLTTEWFWRPGGEDPTR